MYEIATSLFKISKFQEGSLNIYIIRIYHHCTPRFKMDLQNELLRTGILMKSAHAWDANVDKTFNE